MIKILVEKYLCGGKPSFSLKCVDKMLFFCPATRKFFIDRGRKNLREKNRWQIGTHFSHIYIFIAIIPPL